MPNNATKVALVTGANSGLGYEAAAQPCEAGYRKVILACRTLEKAEAARARLAERCGKDIFEGLAIDTAEPARAAAAAEELAAKGTPIDLLLLNAGMAASTLTTNSDGVDLVYASTLVGHHVLTIRLLEQGLLDPGARIVIAGSEASRSDLPGMGGSVADGARRYLDAASYGEDVSGAFFASPPRKMVGPVQRQDTPHLLDEGLQEAAWAAIVQITGSADLELRSPMPEAASA